MNVIETQGLTKRFGAHTAVDHLNLEVPRGSIFGFLGPNGAGKTTTLRMLTGLARPDEGDARIMGHSLRESGQPYLRMIGFLPDVPGFYGWMRAPEYLALAGEIFGLRGKELKSRIGEVLALAGLTGVKTKIGGFSRGMKQRLGLAQALINRPELIFLDEPTSALDPIGRKEVLEEIGSLAGQVTVFFSTHILGDVERVCDNVAVLKEGRLVTQKGIEELRESYTAQDIYVECEGRPDLPALLRGRAWAGEVEALESGWRLKPRDLAAAQRELPALIAAAGLPLRRFDLMEPTLEDIFVKLVNGK